MIFFTDKNPEVAAKNYPDKVLLMVSAKAIRTLKAAILDTERQIRKSSDDLISAWVRKSAGNFNWLAEFGRAALAEYQARIGGVPHPMFEQFKKIEQENPSKRGKKTRFPNMGTPNAAKKNPVTISRMVFQNIYGISANVWSNGKKPAWFDKKLQA